MTQANSYSGIEKIISGGQTGVDRAALDVAIELAIPHGGWCPRGRRAEDGPLEEQYQLTETTSPQYHVRTERNVIDSDATLILYRESLTGGSELTRQFAHRHSRPCHLVDLAEETTPDQLAETLAWLAGQQIHVLNLAGPRESTAPGIYNQAAYFLRELFTQPPA